MSSASPNNSYDELGLDTPFAEGHEDREGLDPAPAWNEVNESPFFETLASADARQENSEHASDSIAGEELAWLDMEAEETPNASEHLDDEERDAGESASTYESQAYFEPEDEVPASTNAPLTAQQRQWILALERSALERLPDATMRDRFLGQDWSDVEFPGNVPRGQHATDEIKRHWALARSLFNAMAGITPERRVPSMIRFRAHPAKAIPGQPAQKLFAEARDGFTRMRDAARADGVELVILSSWRSRSQQASISANQPNPNAAARNVSAHMYGLAIDLQMGVQGLPIKEINTRVDRAAAAKAGTAAKMGNLVRMYRSPVYKWMALRGSEFGWYPYRNEPWHWEYNPPGLKARFEAPHESLAEAEQEDETSGSPSIRTFTARALAVKVAVFVTQAARTARRVEMLVYAHGLDLCKPVLKNRPGSFITGRPFQLGALVEASGRPIVLVVPFLDWEHMDGNGMAFGQKWHRLAQPEHFNAVAAEALEQAGALTGSATAPSLSRLILAGHSRAYGFFDALAHAHASAQMHAGALGGPLHVWALDTTYSAPIADWRAWLASRDDLQATVIYRHGKYRTQGSAVEREMTTGMRGKEFAKLASTSQGRLSVMPVDAGKVAHCAIPATYLPRLLAALPAVENEAEADFEALDEALDEALYETLDETEDLASRVTDAAAPASGNETATGEWTEQATGEEEDEDPMARFDAFHDSRDLEWGAESTEETSPYGESSEAFDTEEHETGLSGSGLTTAEQKAVEITSLFETGKAGGFYGLSGNFDGQGLSFGLVNWTIGTGSLQPLLRDYAKEHPDRWVQVFGPDASSFLQLMARKGNDAVKEQHRFAIEQMNVASTGARGKRVWTVRQPWVSYFKRLSEDPAFQKIQVRYVRDLLARADYYCHAFHLTSEQAFCFMFDAVASHGKWWMSKKFGGVEKRRILVEQAMKALATRFGVAAIPEAELLLAMADVLATTSAQRWADQVRRRKRWFVTGQHPRGRELMRFKPRPDVPYATSVSSARESESDEVPIAGEWETADDPSAILGKWTVRVKDWVWEYDFSPGGKLTWRDTRSNEKGVGRWSMAPKVINLSWSASSTRESWARPLTPARQKGWIQSGYYTGAYEAQKVFAPVAGTATDVDPSVANLSFGLYVDAFIDEAVYDVNYKIPANQSFAFSSKLRAKYFDGATVEFDIDTDFSTVPMTYDEARDAIAHAKLGRDGRIMPSALNHLTTPRLWLARAKALQTQDEEAHSFMGLAVTGVAFALSVPAMPFGMPESAVVATPVSRRLVPGTQIRPAQILGNAVKLGEGMEPGRLLAGIQQTSDGVAYVVSEINLTGKGSDVLVARATHRELIRRAATLARTQNRSTFKMVGKQAAPDFVRHADDMAARVGVTGSGKAGPPPTYGFPWYEVTLVVAKVLSE